MGSYSVHRALCIVRRASCVAAALVLLVTAYSLQLTACYAETVSSKELIENAKSLDGKKVLYKGEAVTAILNRGEYCWINLNDGDNAIGVWSRTSLVKDVKFVGNYKNKGDVLEVVGEFHRACPVHNGELDIHAFAIKIVESGFPLKEEIDRQKARLSAVIFLIILSTAFIFRRRI